MDPMRVYMGTSVFGGYYDEEFEEDTRNFFDLALSGKTIVLVSDTLAAELAGA